MQHGTEQERGHKFGVLRWLTPGHVINGAPLWLLLVLTRQSDTNDREHKGFWRTEANQSSTAAGHSWVFCWFQTLSRYYFSMLSFSNFPKKSHKVSVNLLFFIFYFNLYPPSQNFYFLISEKQGYKAIDFIKVVLRHSKTIQNVLTFEMCTSIQNAVKMLKVAQRKKQKIKEKLKT